MAQQRKTFKDFLLAYFVEVYSTPNSLTERSIQGHKVGCTVCYYLSVF